jgi:methyl-accepting chemotaxis protein
VTVWLWNLDLVAGKIYTWIDSKGVTHITDEPPPATGKLEEVIEYTPKSAEEIQKIRQEQELRLEERQKEVVLENARKARKIADDAKMSAEEAQKIADEANQRALDFKNKVGKDTDRIKRNRSKIRKLESEAQKANDMARQALEVSRQAEEQAKRAEKRATEILNQNIASEEKLTETEKR